MRYLIRSHDRNGNPLSDAKIADRIRRGAVWRVGHSRCPQCHYFLSFLNSRTGRACYASACFHCDPEPSNPRTPNDT